MNIISRICGPYEGFAITSEQRLGDYEGIRVLKNDRPKLELRISRTAIVNEPCGLSNINLHDWLFKTAISILREMESEGINGSYILLITSNDVENQELKTNWTNLKQVE